MKKSFIHKTIIYLAIICALCCGASPVFADETSDEYGATSRYSISPMNQKISLVPGERYYGTFKITNPADNPYSFAYETDISPFHVDNDYQIIYDNNGDYNQIVEWITVENSTGLLLPNETEIVRFYVDVPENAPAGGQYATIIVKPTDSNATTSGVNIRQKYNIAHILYAEVAGETVRKGEITQLSVPSFLFSGMITASASIRNSGNVHSDGVYTLQIFPLFSNEEIYTNEEDPMTNTIMPETTRSTAISWSETPAVGIFHVIFKASFEGVESKVDKIVIVCPLWLLFLILLAIFLIIFRILSAKKTTKKKETK